MLQGEAPHVQEAPLQGVPEGRGRGGGAGAQGRAGEEHVGGPRVVAHSVAVRHERTEAEEGGGGAGHLDGWEDGDMGGQNGSVLGLGSSLCCSITDIS